MKPSGQLKRPKDWLPFVNFAIIRGMPARLKLADHLFPYIGCEDDPDFIWGVYGTTSINAAIFSAASYAAEMSRKEPGAQEYRAQQLTAWFRIDDFRSIPTQMDHDDVSRHGYLHIGRMASPYRESLRAEWASWLREVKPEAAEALGPALDALHLDELAVRFPQYVRVMLRKDPSLHAVIHPVFQTYQDVRIPFWLLTARRDPSRLMAAEARFASVVDVMLA